MKLIIAAGLFLLASASLSFTQPLFAPPVNLGPKINTSAYESDPFWDGPRERLYFVSARTGFPGIYFADQTDTGWTDPILLGPQINNLSGQQSPSVSTDGQRLYFVSDSRQGYLWDVWVSTWDSSLSDWGTPVNVGYPVNTPNVEFSAHLAPDGRLLFSSSADPDSLFPFGRCGIYASEWDGFSWSVPELQWGCGTEPEYPSIPANGQWLYFDEIVGSICVVAWGDSDWVLPAYNLNQQLGGRAATPFITASGESLFFSGTPDLGGFGSQDIWLAKRLLLGDLNLDSQLTATDVVLELNKVYLDEPYPAPEAMGDLNCDNQFTPADVVLLLRRVYLAEPPGC